MLGEMWYEENGVTYWPSSYEVRDGSGWIAQAHVVEVQTGAPEVTPFWPAGSRRFQSKEDADSAAVQGAHLWVLDGRPPIAAIF